MISYENNLSYSNVKVYLQAKNINYLKEANLLKMNTGTLLFEMWNAFSSFILVWPLQKLQYSWKMYWPVQFKITSTTTLQLQYISGHLAKVCGSAKFKSTKYDPTKFSLV